MTIELTENSENPNILLCEHEEWGVESKRFPNMPYAYKFRTKATLLKDNNDLICVNEKTMEKVETIPLQIVCIERSTNKEISSDTTEIRAEKFIEDHKLKEKLMTIENLEKQKQAIEKMISKRVNSGKPNILLCKNEDKIDALNLMEKENE